MTAYPNQLSNRNFLSPTGFKLILDKIPGVEFFCQASNIPGLSSTTPVMPTPLKDVYLPGDVLDYEDLSLRFIIDEDLINYTQIQNWLVGLTFPDRITQYNEYFIKTGKYADNVLNETSDGTLIVLTSNYNPGPKIKYKGLFPTRLEALRFDVDATDIKYFTAEVSFKYLIYEVYGKDGKKLTI